MDRISNLSLLLVEDDDDHAELIESIFTRRTQNRRAANLHRVKSANEGLDWMDRMDFDAVLLDLSLPDSAPDSTLRTFTTRFPDAAIVVLTSLEDEYLAANAIELGAQDYLDKSHLNRDLVIRSILYAVERKKVLTRLEQQNEELKHFAHTVAHEFKSPLQSIVTAFCFLEESKEDLKEPLQKLIHLGNLSADRLNALVNGLLDFAESTGDEALSDEVNLREVTQEILDTPHIALDLATFEVRVSDDLPTVRGARLQLRQVLQNLITNAVKYRKGDDLVIVIGAERKEDMWEIYVRDNGVGIKEEHQERVFEPFFRVFSRDEIPGTGIGLGFCKGVVERHGGEMWVESEFGEGSTFYFSLPIND